MHRLRYPYIRRSSHGFDFLGYHLTLDGLTPATQTWQHVLQRIAQLYEQGAAATPIEQYVRNWLRWLGSGLGERLVACISMMLDKMTMVIRTLQNRIIQRERPQWLYQVG